MIALRILNKYHFKPELVPITSVFAMKDYAKGYVFFEAKNKFDVKAAIKVKKTNDLHKINI